jgi:hypothetical protein
MPSAENDAPVSEDVLDREGEWEIRVTIYRNDRRVATCDTIGHATFDHAAYWVGEGLKTREVEMHQPRRRPRVIPPEVPTAENDAPESVCSDCGMPGQCAACYLMATRGIPTPPRVIPPAKGVTP